VEEHSRQSSTIMQDSDNSPDILGVECDLCHQETFRTVERMAYVKVKCCISCADRLDAEDLERAESELMKGMSKAERLQRRKEMSHEWAWGWNGKHVIVKHGYSPNKGIRGMAYYNSKHEDRGYGRLQVVIDKAELHRVTFKEDRRWERKHIEAYVDGDLYGLARHLIDRDSYREGRYYPEPLAIRVNWGDRDKLVLVEVDPEADRREAQAEAERQRIEQEKEAARHLGEGI
jgi:hypothetical protein